MSVALAIESGLGRESRTKYLTYCVAFRPSLVCDTSTSFLHVTSPKRYLIITGVLGFPTHFIPRYTTYTSNTRTIISLKSVPYEERGIFLDFLFGDVSRPSSTFTKKWDRVSGVFRQKVRSLPARQSAGAIPNLVRGGSAGGLPIPRGSAEGLLVPSPI